MIKDFIISALITEMLLGRLPLDIRTFGERVWCFVGIYICTLILVAFIDDFCERMMNRYLRSKRLQRKVRNLTRR